MTGRRDRATVVVVGAGIVGVGAALTLAEQGAAVTVLDRGLVAGEASGLNAGLIGGGGRATNQAGAGRAGKDRDVAVGLRRGSRARFVELSDDRGHDIGLRCSGMLTLIRTEAEWAWASDTVAASRASGLDYELIDRAALADMEPSTDAELLGAIFDPEGATAEPVAATKALAAEAIRAGAKVETGVQVHDFNPTDSGWQLTVTGTGMSGGAGLDERRTIGADVVLLAAGPWCRQLGAKVGLDVPIRAVRGQMWATAPGPPLLGFGLAAAESPLHFSAEVLSDDQVPYVTHRDGRRTTRHLYGRQRPNGEIVFGGDRVVTDDRSIDHGGIAVNRGQAIEMVPALARWPIVRRWSGLMPFSTDGRPLIGAVPGRPGLFLAGGLASSGFGRGPMTGRLAAELILGLDTGYDLSVVDLRGRVVETAR